MARQKRQQTLFVIFAGVQQPAPLRTSFIARDGSTTTLKSKAAIFDTFVDASVFAERNHIALNGRIYIGLETFADRDLFPPHRLPER